MRALVWKVVRHSPGALAATLLVWIGLSCVPIGTGVVQQGIFDGLQFQGEIPLVVLLFIALAALRIVQPAIAMLWIWLHHTVELRMEALVRTNLVRWVMDESGRSSSPQTPMALVGHVRDDVPLFVDIVNEWYRIVGEGVFVVVAFSIMLSIDATITIATFAPVAAVVAFTHWKRARLPDLVGRARDSTVAVTKTIGDLFAGVVTVKVFNAGNDALRRLDGLNARRRRAEVSSRSSVAWIEAISEASIYGGKGLVLLIGAGAMLEGRLSVGDFILFSTYLDWMLDLPRRIGRLLSQRKISQKAIARLRETMDPEPVASLVRKRPTYLRGPLPVVENPRQRAADRLDHLEVRNLSFRYPPSDSTDGTRTAAGISDVSFAVPRGSLTVVTGAVGAGKSTLLAVVLGLRRAVSGDIYWNGRKVTHPERFMTSPRVAYRPQTPALFSDSLRENVLLGLTADEATLNQALRDASLLPDLAQLEDGIETLVGPRGTRLSGGQVQRVGIARMFVRTASLYAIDDLSNALDAQTEAEILQAIDARRTSGEGTFLIVSHKPRILERADQIVALEQGRVVGCGTPAELRESCPVVRSIMAVPLPPAPPPRHSRGTGGRD